MQMWSQEIEETIYRTLDRDDIGEFFCQICNEERKGGGWK